MPAWANCCLRWARSTARAAFTQELGLDPDEFTSNLNMGVLAKQDQDTWRRAATSSARSRTRPNDPGVRYQMANVDLATGNPDQARRRWKL
jgi:hypothetical protein